MTDYTIVIETKSDIIFGNGQSVSGFIDADVLHDEYGFPYMNGKTFKGKLGEMANLFVQLIKKAGRDSDALYAAKDKLFGIEGITDVGGLKFSDCEMSENVRHYIQYHQKTATSIKKEEVLDALTYVDRQTSIDYETGVAEKSSLRNFRVIKRGLKFYCRVHAPRNLNEQERYLLAGACKLLRHLGSQETKGKGSIETTLLLDHEDVSTTYLNFEKEGVV